MSAVADLFSLFSHLCAKSLLPCSGVLPLNAICTRAEIDMRSIVAEQPDLANYVQVRCILMAVRAVSSFMVSADCQ
jgi:hypothetical protein